MANYIKHYITAFGTAGNLEGLASHEAVKREWVRVSYDVPGGVCYRTTTRSMVLDAYSRTLSIRYNLRLYVSYGGDGPTAGRFIAEDGYATKVGITEPMRSPFCTWKERELFIKQHLSTHRLWVAEFSEEEEGLYQLKKNT